MAGYRIDRVSEDIKREIIAIMREIKDPRVSGMLTVVKVVVSHQKIVHIISAYEETEVTPIRKSYSFNHRKKFCGQGMPGNTKERRG